MSSRPSSLERRFGLVLVRVCWELPKLNVDVLETMCDLEYTVSPMIFDTHQKPLFLQIMVNYGEVMERNIR